MARKLFFVYASALAGTLILPPDYNPLDNIWHLIGAPGLACAGNLNTSGGCGASTGAYAGLRTSLNELPGTVLDCDVPLAGAARMAYLKNSSGVTVLQADYGRNGIFRTTGYMTASPCGLAINSIGDMCWDGAKGGDGRNAAGGAGAGSPGPNGPGRAGGSNINGGGDGISAPQGGGCDGGLSTKGHDSARGSYNDKGNGPLGDVGGHSANWPIPSDGVPGMRGSGGGGGGCYHLSAFIGSVSGTTLTITNLTFGPIKYGYQLHGDSVSVLAGTVITGPIAVNPDGTGTYSINLSQSVSSTTLNQNIPDRITNGGAGSQENLWFDPATGLWVGPGGGGGAGSGHQSNGSRGGHGGPGGGYGAGGGGGGGTGWADPLDPGTPVPGAAGTSGDAILVCDYGV